MKYCSSEYFKLPGFGDDRLSKCWVDTTISVFTVFLIAIIAIRQLIISHRLSRNNVHFNWSFYKKKSVPHPKLYKLQLFLNGLMPFLGLLRLISLCDGNWQSLFGSQLLSIIQEFLIWPIICILIFQERSSKSRLKTHSLGILFVWGWIFIVNNLEFLKFCTQDWEVITRTTAGQFGLGVFVVQYVSTLFIVGLGIYAPGIRRGEFTEIDFKEENFLLANGHGNGVNFYGSHTQPERPTTPRSVNDPYLVKVRILLPFLWPSKSVLFQFYAFVCLLLFVVGRVANTFVPIYSKHIVDSMSFSNSNHSVNDTHIFHIRAENYHIVFRWDYILIYVLLKFVQGGVSGSGGLITSVSNILWINVQQYTARELEVKFFEHLHQLSHRWHLQRKTGAVLRAMDRGTESFNNILNYVLFNVLPTFVDVVVAVVYFTTAFNAIFGLIVFTTIIIYLVATFCMTEWRTKVNRAKNDVDNAKKQMSLDSLLNYETIKDYTNECFEKNRYLDMVIKYQKQEWYFNLSMSLNDMVQLVIINIGLLTGSLLCVENVTEGLLSVGDYVLFASYLIQLFEPLNNFGKYYKSLQRSFLDLENLLDVLREELEIMDAPNAKPLKITNGTVEFRNVSFSYVPERRILNQVSFTVPPGTSLALVGPSGSGKTTITRLLLRFYELSSGQILIDGQNIKSVSQKSLRKAIGIVPQDSILFNESIKYNVKYGRVNAKDEEIFAAADLACINAKIKSFPQGYNTVVGERGLKLSGGEKQRVAIARAVLKNPRIVLLDEATSSLDTQTERQIQTSLQSLCENRTSIIVAHRLSTIAHADQILVIKDGNVVESGTHEILLQMDGLYSRMWNDQLKCHEDVGEFGEIGQSM